MGQDANAKVHLVWGLEDVDRSGVSLLRDSQNKGTVVYNERFSFDEAAQLHIFSVCEEVSQYGPAVSSFLSADLDAEILSGKVECPLFDFKAWLESRGKTFPVPAAEVGSAMAEFLKAQVKGAFDASQSYEQKWQNAIGYSDSLKQVRFMIVSVESTLPERGREAHDTLEEQYNLFEDWLERLNREAPESGKGAFHVAANSVFGMDAYANGLCLISSHWHDNWDSSSLCGRTLCNAADSRGICECSHHPWCLSFRVGLNGGIRLGAWYNREYLPHNLGWFLSGLRSASCPCVCPC